MADHDEADAGEEEDEEGLATDSAADGDDAATDGDDADARAAAMQRARKAARNWRRRFVFKNGQFVPRRTPATPPHYAPVVAGIGIVFSPSGALPAPAKEADGAKSPFSRLLKNGAFPHVADRLRALGIVEPTPVQASWPPLSRAHRASLGRAAGG